MANNKRFLKVFLCYGRDDVKSVRTLYERLTNDGIDVWFDRVKLVPGQEWEREISSAVPGSDVVIVCHSKLFNQQGFRQKEVQLALEAAKLMPKGGIFIIPARLEECEVLEDLRRWQWVDLFDEEGYRNLLRALCLRVDKINETLQGKKVRLPRKSSLETRATSVRLRTANDVKSPLELIIYISIVVKLWDDFDAGAKKENLSQLARLSRTVDLTDISSSEISKAIFDDSTRRRLWLSEELRALFPQLHPSPKISRPIGHQAPINYKAIWSGSQKSTDSQQIVHWLKQHYLIANPFGGHDFKNHPFYADGCTHPDRWEAFLDSVPMVAYGPTLEDAKTLAHLLRAECFPVTRAVYIKGKEEQVLEFNRQIFPILVSFEQKPSSKLLLPLLANSAALTWFNILPLSPNAMLDLSRMDQQELLELFHWSIGSNKAIINLIHKNGLKNDAAGRMLTRKISGFESRYSATDVPQDSDFHLWLKIRPPKLDLTYLILPVDDLDSATHPWLLDQLTQLVPTLFVNGIVMKVVSSFPVALPFSLPEIQLSWSDTQLKLSLDGQFDAAMDVNEKYEMGKAIRFHELFGPGATEDLDNSLINASHNSLARLLTLGNLLFQKHCAQEEPEKYLSSEELDDIL